MKNIHLAIALLIVSVSFSNLQAQEYTFKEIKKDFPQEGKNLRKWDSPVIADLDQDGYPDMLLNEHGFGIQVAWNNQGKFAKPIDVIMGDLHGLTVGDFDRDGLLEIVMSRGGGSGGNARNSKLYRVDKERNFTPLSDFDAPLALMRGRTVKFVDGDGDGDLDLLNFAFPDKDKKGASENYIYKNDGKGQLVLAGNLPPVKTDGQKMLLTDFDGDNVQDIVLYGHGAVKMYQGKGDLTYKDVSKKVLPNDIKDVTGVVELDYDNDGDFDLFFTRGKDFKIGETFFDSETKVWGFYTKRGAFKFDDLETGDILNIENFQSQWPDNDAYYIGESGYDYEFEGETHSGKDIRLINSDALGYPDNKNLKDRGWHIGYIGNRKWRIAGHLWAPATGIVRGVEHYPTYEHPAGLADILLENKNGKFKNITKEANLFLKEHTTGAAVADFDNNGMQDLLIICRGDLIHANESLLYLNRGGKFERISQHNIISNELGAIGMSGDVIDYNMDGKVDIILGNERGKFHLFKNTIPKNNLAKAITIEIGNSPTGEATALGAVVTAETCGKKQVRRVGTTGAQYSLSFNPFVHFGLGECGETVKIEVKWSNGETIDKTVENSAKRILIGKKGQ